MGLQGTATPPAPAAAPVRRWPRRLAWLLIPPVLALGLLWTLAASQRALDWAIDQATAAAAAVGVELTVEAVSGSLLGTVRAARLAASREGLAVEARGVEIDLDLLRLAAQALRTRVLALDRLSVAELRIETRPSGEPTTLPESLALPMAVSLPRVAIERLEWTGGGAPVAITGLRAAYAGDGDRHRIESLALRWQAPQAGPPVDVEAAGSLAAQAPYPLAFTLRAGWGAAVPASRGSDLLPPAEARAGGAGRAGQRPPHASANAPAALAGAIRATIEGSLQEPRLQLDAEASRGAARARGRLEAVLQPFAAAGPRLESARGVVRGVDPARWWPGAPAARLDLEVEASGVASRLAGHLRVANAQAGPADAGRLPVVAIESPWSWDGPASRLRLATLRVQLPHAASLGGQLSLEWPRGGRARIGGEINGRDIDLRALHGGWPATRLAGRLGLAADAAAQRADLVLTQAGLRFEARLEHGAASLRVPSFRLQVPGRAGPGEALGRLEANLRDERAFVAEVTLRAFDLSALHDRAPGVGEVAPEPTRASPPVIRGAAGKSGAGPGPGAVPAPAATGSPSRGPVEPPRAGSASAAVATPWPAALLNGRASVHGHLRPDWHAALEVALAPSEVRVEGRVVPVRGELRGRLDRQRVDALDLRLESGRNRLRAVGTYGRPGDGLDLTVDLTDLSALLARSSGRLAVKARLDGTPARPELAFRATGESVAARGLTIAALEVTGTVSAAAEGTASPLTGMLRRIGPARVEAQARRLVLPGQGPFDLTVRLAGDPARHQLDVEGRASGAEARATVVGAVESGPRWQGELRQLDGRSRIPVKLLAPVAVTAGPGELRVGPARLTVAGGRIGIETLEWRAGRLTTRGSLAAIPLGPIHDLLAGRPVDRPGPAPIVSTLEIGGEWALAATPELNGTVSLRRERGDLSLAGPRPFPLGLSRSDVDLRFESGRLRGRARVEGSAVGEASATLALDPAPRLDADAALALRVDAHVRSLRPFARLLPAVAEIDGTFGVRLEAGGTLRQPVLSGTLTGQRLRVDAPQVGVALREGRVEATLAAGLLTVGTLEARGGEGRFSASGAIPLRPGGGASSLRWQADRLALLTRPDRRVVLDGQGALGFERGQYRLAGQLRAREGYIEFGRGNRASLGEDVMVRGRSAPAAPSPSPGERALALQLDFDFGDAFRLIGSGLDTLVRGRIALATTDSGQLSTRGTVSTERGTFTAFGQRLEIDRGTIVFNGPVDNPGLDIVALRRLPSVQAGVELSGTARAPRVRITSNPPLPQGEQLSWLVLGRALDSASQADAALLAGAAAAMFGGDGGVPVNRRIADAFGLDDVGVRSSGVLSGQVVTVGKRVSDRVYFAYEQAVSTASNLLRIDFELHRFLSLRAEAGSVSGFGLVFTRNLR